MSSPYYSRESVVPLFLVSVVYNVVAHVLLQLTGRLGVETLHPRRVSTKVAIVTGSNTGIGFETAKSLVVDYGYTVILACRSRDKAQQAAATINAATVAEGKAVFLHPLDLSSFDSVREFCRQLKLSYPRVSVLVNNAGRNTSGDSTERGLDLLFQSNFLGHFCLTAGLMENDILAKDARIVNLTSVTHHFCGYNPIHEVNFWKACAMEVQEPLRPYAQSKLAALLFTLELNRRYGDRIRSIAVNPGLVNSDIWRNVPRWVIPIFQTLYLTSRQGCRTSVVAAVADNLPPHANYLQPYWMPSKVVGPAWPVFETMGPYRGHVVVQGRLPLDGGEAASAALWQASEELTPTGWPKKST